VPVTEFLVKHTGAVKRLYSERKAQDQERASPLGGDGTTGDALEDASEQDIDAEDTTAEGGHDLSLAEFKQRLADAFAEEKTDKDVWKDVVDKIAACGPRRVGPNVLIDLTEDNLCEKL